MPKSISILLGAGVSAPVGYPVGQELNDMLLACKGSEFGFHSSGVLCVDTQKGSRPDFGFRTSYDIEFDFCIALIQYYNNNVAEFDYEEFYDYIIEKAESDKGAAIVAQPFLGTFQTNVPGLIRKLKNIFNQMVGFYLKDREGKTWYDDEAHMCKPIFPGYTGILNCLEHLGTNNIVNIHTLNHDLFFERLAITDWLQGDLCDGFEELGSPYYGKPQSNNRSYKVRLQFFNEKYDKKFRLYKLHGSRDYGVYYGAKGAVLTPQAYLKTRFG